jgi:two-component system, NtrC family, response regulator AtoC
MPTIAIIDDEPLIREYLLDFLTGENYHVNTFSSGEEALPIIKENPPDLILLDLKLPGMSGMEILKSLKHDNPEIIIIIITGHGDISASVEAIKQGAWDFILKPAELAEINYTIQRALDSKLKDEKILFLQNENRKKFDTIIGESEEIKNVLSLIDIVSKSSKTSVLIRGETGTGKGLAARMIHNKSKREQYPFVEINCSAMQESLLESELFGYEQGAFTGANARKKGLLEIADHGTFFLDEIGDMSLSLQSKLLKVIEEKKFYRLGGQKEISIDVRFISATSKNLEEYILNNKFRKDLIFRLNVVSITIPPLKNRGKDVILIADYYLKLFNRELRRNIISIDESAQKVLLEYDWPGNIRELRNIIERAVIFEKRSGLSAHALALPKSSIGLPSTDSEIKNLQEFKIPATGISLAEVERNLIKNALQHCMQNKTKAAKLLGISRDKIRYKIKKYKLDK